MPKLRPLALLGILLLALCFAGRSTAARDDAWSAIDRIAAEHIAAKDVPGVVFLVGSHGKIVYRKAFGNRAVQPSVVPMTVDTEFDLASLTKVIGTTSAIMALVEDGKLRIGDPISRYWPEFAQNGKGEITIRQCMTHTSGLIPDDPFYQHYDDPNGPQVQDHRAEVFKELASDKPRTAPDIRFVYSDLNYVTLMKVAEIVSGEPMQQYLEHRVFRPLGMRDTAFYLNAEQKARCAPTQIVHGKFLQGDVHDPTAQMLNGVGGDAGLFSTADDLAKFAGMLLSSDRPDSKRYPLSPATVRLMTTPHSPPGLPVRGLGWDIDSPYSHVKGDLMPVGSFGHTGFTGTFIWVDPTSETFVIGLSNRVHPDGKGNPLRMWAQVCNVVQGIVRPQTLPAREGVAMQPVLSGIDVLQRDGFKELQGRKVGLITNRTGVNRERVSTIDLLHKAPGVELKALFSPEHGLRTDRDEPVDSSQDEKTGLPVYSLYGQGKYKPLPEQLKGLDTLVFDIQDAGVRYYTYITTLGLCMEAAKENGLRFVVLDRPNPINGLAVEGPLMDLKLRNFAGWYKLPIRYGLTEGELARLYNAEFGIGCDLQVVQMEGWHRRLWYDETGLPWIDPSPNLRSQRAAELYASVGLLESANVSVGRGTDTPFERFGAPWIDGAKLAAELNRRQLLGCVFMPVRFTPNASVFKDQLCNGVEVRLTDRNGYDGSRTAAELMDALVRLFPKDAKIDKTSRMWGVHQVPDDIAAGRSVADVIRSWSEDVTAFRKVREKYLMYR